MTASANIAVGVDTSVKSADRLSFTVFIAIVAHAMLIFGLTFTLPQPDELAPTLEITLANHQSERAPEDASFLAQHNQEASGTELANQELTTEREADFAAPDVNEVNPVPQIQAATPTAEQNTRMVTTLDAERSILQNRDEEREQKEDERIGLPDEQPLITPEIASLQAKLDRQRQEYAKRPRIRRLTSVATKTAPEAQYLLNWSRKVEQMGNANYPQQALAQRLTGSLRMAVTLNANGTIRELELSESSGVGILDEAALQIVRMAAPFDPIPPEVREKYDQLQIIRTWSFEIDGLTTSAARNAL
ncbi:energy transducer TonB [Gilvimarinus algae]|uniref:Energy transducer TonB n=1 Tax=Gilvimarinus algae TaxID=3058037 RepID=A0ABT8TGG5_9GAMM|nr:energy transducer TonB [Gilvimarinus sp. SDUM040014]MDO3383176.1 energy transducer TonB [Gilvimarinus sp. SDUM040014]